MGLAHAAGDYRLRRKSPCVDTGSNIPELLDGSDLDGAKRKRGSFMDMGACEWQPPAGSVIMVR